jgi:hypothetical protein
MAKVVNKQVQMSRSEIIKFQIITHCYVNKLFMSEADYNCLTLLAAIGPYDLTDFCTLTATHGIFKSTQTVRNCLVRMERQGLILKEGKSKKKISINPEMMIQTQGDLLLNYKFFHIGPKAS